MYGTGRFLSFFGMYGTGTGECTVFFSENVRYCTVFLLSVRYDVRYLCKTSIATLHMDLNETSKLFLGLRSYLIHFTKSQCSKHISKMKIFQYSSGLL